VFCDEGAVNYPNFTDKESEAHTSCKKVGSAEEDLTEVAQELTLGGMGLG
jgi:hypothetical protein